MLGQKNPHLPPLFSNESPSYSQPPHGPYHCACFVLFVSEGGLRRGTKRERRALRRFCPADVLHDGQWTRFCAERSDPTMATTVLRAAFFFVFLSSGEWVNLYRLLSRIPSRTPPTLLRPNHLNFESSDVSHVGQIDHDLDHLDINLAV